MTWVKGQSGNPAGGSKRRKENPDVIKMCRDATPMAVRRMIHLCQYAEDESVQAKAAAFIVDRAYGKAAQSVKVSGDADDPIQLVLNVVTERLTHDAAPRVIEVTAPAITQNGKHSEPESE